MTLIRPSLDYTDKDFDALRARLFNIIPSAFPAWTDKQVADFGNLLVEMFAFVGDVLTFYQDNQAQESRWTTAHLRRSLLSMLKLIDYKPTGSGAASATLSFLLSAPPLAAVTIRKGDVFSTLDSASPITFYAAADVTIEANANPPIAFVDVENSKRSEENYFSTELPNQAFTLADIPFLDGSLEITTTNGPYTIVDDFLSSTSTSAHAVVTVDENSRALITFGDGVAGAIPSGTITFKYRTGGGASGNVAPNTITRIQGTYVDANGNPVIASVTNTAKAGGGADAQTNESIRETAPRSLRTLTRTVTREDYEINALRVPGVARALMLTRDENLGIQENTGRLYIVPTGGGYATQALLDNVIDMVTNKYPKTITFKLAVLSAPMLVVNVSTRVWIAKGAIASQVAKVIRAAVQSFFAVSAADGSQNNNIDFGYYLDGAIAWSDVFNAVRDVPGVRKVDDGLGNLVLNGQSDDLEIPVDRFPRLGSITVIDASTGAAIP